MTPTITRIIGVIMSLRRDAATLRQSEEVPALDCRAILDEPSSANENDNHQPRNEQDVRSLIHFISSVALLPKFTLLNSILHFFPLSKKVFFIFNPVSIIT